jgi:EpsI family protein
MLQSSQTLGNRAYSFLSDIRFQIATLSIFFYLAYADTFKELWNYWIEGYNWQFIVPIGFVYMLWDRKDLYVGIKREPNIFFGTVFLVLACALLVIGQISSTNSLREVSIIASMFSLALLLLGFKFTQRLFWPLLFLILMTSLTSDVLEHLRHPLKLISATVAEVMLRFTGYSVYRDGAFLQLPHITLEVADSCSGLNQLVSAIALGILIAFTSLNLWWKRVFIILLSIGLGLVMNWVRVYLISIWHYNSAKEEIHGPMGIYELPFIFLVGVFVTIVVATLIADKIDTSKQDAVSGVVLDRLAVRKSSAAYFISVFVLLSTAIYLNSWKANQVSLKSGFSNFPMIIHGLQGKPIAKLGSPFYSDLAHDELILQFSNQTGIKAKVYLGYFHSQDQEKELIDYRYNWLQDDASTIELPSSSSPVQIKVNHVKTRTREMTVFFWYDVNGKILTNPIKVKLASLADALWKRQTNGAIVIVQIEGDQEEPSADAKAFVNQVLILSQEYLRTEENFFVNKSGN